MIHCIPLPCLITREYHPIDPSCYTSFSVSCGFIGEESWVTSSWFFPNILKLGRDTDGHTWRIQSALELDSIAAGSFMYQHLRERFTCDCESQLHIKTSNGLTSKIRVIGLSGQSQVFHGFPHLWNRWLFTRGLQHLWKTIYFLPSRLYWFAGFLPYVLPYLLGLILFTQQHSNVSVSSRQHICHLKVGDVFHQCMATCYSTCQTGKNLQCSM